MVWHYLLPRRGCVAEFHGGQRARSYGVLEEQNGRYPPAASELLERPCKLRISAVARPGLA